MRSRASRAVSSRRASRGTTTRPTTARTTPVSLRGSRAGSRRGGRRESVGGAAGVVRAPERARGGGHGPDRAEQGAAPAAPDRALCAGHTRRGPRDQPQPRGNRPGAAHARARDGAPARRGTRQLSLLALSDGVVTAWWIALGALLVVAVVVTLLLEILRRTVHEVRTAVDSVLAAGGQLAQHTWTVQLLATTKDRALELVEELEQEPTAVRTEGGPS